MYLELAEHHMDTDVVPIHTAYNQATKPSSSGTKTNWGSGKLSRGCLGLEISKAMVFHSRSSTSKQLPPKADQPENTCSKDLRSVSLLPFFERKTHFLPIQTVNVILDSRYENPSFPNPLIYVNEVVQCSYDKNKKKWDILIPISFKK